ncbi:unnamed protein product [Tuber melanosporum]|jgi:hypothetical protein|uniref:(Perigord truffle) hypothetical protein n=1 Tax=Tuber melanosporum (strain Mel28) TaxID=656061 RepID=D5GEK0_TUBMM|nr:uncharacterized protein GSTUM_00006528001 [Tuber melanosporum]CAZ82943.1 unnamed protein product [Tuber melanosporum]
MPPKKRASPTKTSLGSGPNKKTKTPPVVDGPSKYVENPLSFIEYVELQDPNEEPDVEVRHLRKEKKDYTGSEVKISKEGYDNLIKMYIEVEKRTPESNGIAHIYEDYAGYGIIEVMEKQILQYEKEKKKSHFELKLYAIVEALVFFLDSSYDGRWMHVDDGDRVEELMCLMGTLFVDCFRELDKETPIGRWLAPPDKTPLKNLGLIMGLAIGAAGCWMGDAESMDFWSQEIERMAEARGIQLRNCSGPIKEKSDGTKMLDFSSQLKAYKKRNGAPSIGGNHFDLSKISEAERRRLDEGDIFDI